MFAHALKLTMSIVHEVEQISKWRQKALSEGRFSRVIFLKFRADYQMSTKRSNILQIEDIVLCKIFQQKGLY